VFGFHPGSMEERGRNGKVSGVDKSLFCQGWMN
jgi:hypothetical protein